MIVTIGRKPYILGENDYCIYNGYCYILMTQTELKDHMRQYIRFPKTLMNRLLKEGKAYETGERFVNRMFRLERSYPIYRFREVDSE